MSAESILLSGLLLEYVIKPMNRRQVDAPPLSSSRTFPPVHSCFHKNTTYTTPTDTRTFSTHTQMSLSKREEQQHAHTTACSDLVNPVDEFAPGQVLRKGRRGDGERCYLVAWRGAEGLCTWETETVLEDAGHAQLLRVGSAGAGVVIGVGDVETQDTHSSRRRQRATGCVKPARSGPMMRVGWGGEMPGEWRVPFPQNKPVPRVAKGEKTKVKRLRDEWRVSRC